MVINLQLIMYQLCNSKITKTHQLKDPEKQLSNNWTRFMQMFINIDGSWETAHQQFYKVNMKNKIMNHGIQLSNHDNNSP